ncbi:MAG TPA: hypothetical protein VGU71_06665 [Candidatus Dormibacteraeota bacterium]|nr:hypothetical protein [Candidatus Dormibacteraeota bacterium]
MEPSPASRLTARKRRAVGLIAFSVLALAVASLAWIVPGLHQGDTANPITRAATPSLPPSYPITYAFVNRSLGWAEVARPGGGSTIFKTEDGGNHWSQLTTLVGNWIGTLQFVDPTHGFVLTSHPNQLYRTTDGGAHWVPIAIPQGQTGGITFADARLGWSVVPPASPSQLPAIYLTTDGGDTWVHFSDLPQDTYGLVLRGSEAWLSAQGYEAGRLHVYASFDNGLTWTSRAVPRPPGSVAEAANPPAFFARVALLPGSGVMVFVSTGPMCQKSANPCSIYDVAEFASFDGGSTWTYVPPPPGEYFDSGYEDARHWWAAVGGTFYKSSDAGRTWKQIPGVLLPPGRYSFHFFDSQHAWVQVSTPVVDSQDPEQVRRYFSMLLFTSDAGLHWVKVNSPKLS